MLGDFVKDIRMAMRKLDGARRLKIGMVAIAVLLCSSFFLPASPLQEQALYFLSGTFNGGGQWPVRLYKVDAAQEIVTFIREVAPSSETVIADYDHGVLVIASPPNAPNTLDTVFMDSPSKLSRESLSYDAKKFLPESIFELNIAMNGPVVALALGQMWRQIDPQPATRLLGVAVASSDDSPFEVPWNSLEGVRTSGYVGGELPVDNQYVPEVRGNPLHIIIDDPNGVSTGIPRPAYLKPVDEFSDSYRLFAANDEITGLFPFLPPNGSVVDIKVGPNGAWSRIELPMVVSRPRAFGYWIAAIATEPRNQNASASERRTEYNAADLRNLRSSPGQETRAGERIGKRGTVDDLFSSSQSFYPGALIVIDSRTKGIFTVMTGTGDSEVVLVTDQAVYYRADHSLYKADFVAGKLTKGSLIAGSPEIAQAHWAFLSPAKATR
jgi:hypothetical protein